MTLVIGIAAGYVAAIYTWPKVKEFVNGAKAEADKLRAKADALYDKAKAAL